MLGVYLVLSQLNVSCGCGSGLVVRVGCHCTHHSLHLMTQHDSQPINMLCEHDMASIVDMLISYIWRI